MSENSVCVGLLLLLLLLLLRCAAAEHQRKSCSGVCAGDARGGSRRHLPMFVQLTEHQATMCAPVAPALLLLQECCCPVAAAPSIPETCGIATAGT
jgi:hypothetical protein